MKNKINSRTANTKALQAVQSILDKYPKGIEDIASISEEKRSWIQMKVQHLRQCTQYIFLEGYHYGIG